jgi:Uma2 family endonuclease
MSIAATRVRPTNDYPTRDGRPMAETDIHRILMVTSIDTLDHFFAEEDVYVSGNLLVFYERGNKRRHVAPDTFVVKGVPKGSRDNYLIWEERPLDAAIEYTSKSTRDEDLNFKFQLYERLKVKEYFLFDPLDDYLDPRLQGYRLRRGKYAAIRPVDGRLPSQVLGLHLEQDGRDLRLCNPVSKQWLPTAEERLWQPEAAQAPS